MGSQVQRDSWVWLQQGLGRPLCVKRLALLSINLGKNGKGLLVVKKIQMFRKTEGKLKPAALYQGRSSSTHPHLLSCSSLSHLLGMETRP